METLEELQPEVELGGKILLQKLELAIFSQRLKGIAVATKRSPAGGNLADKLENWMGSPHMGGWKKSTKQRF